MIKFFRQIRQKLLSENKLSKYLIYAVGEIILVVIGILIALQINNKNEFNKSYTSTVNTLSQLKYELGQDIIFLKNEIAYSKRVKDYFNDIKSKNFNEVNVENTFQYVTANLSKPPISMSYDKLNKSGNIDIIRDSTLINSLHDYYLEERHKYTKFANYNAEFTSDKIEGYLIYKLEIDENLKSTEASVINELDNGNLINLINYQSTVYDFNEEMAQRMLQKAEHIISLIDDEIDS